MKKLLLIILVLVLSLPVVVASDTCFKDRQCILWADVTTNITFFNASEANITIKDPLGVEIVSNVAMEKNSDGIFKYEYTPTEFGNYFGYVEYYDQIGIKVSQAQMSWSSLEVFNMIWTIFLIFAMGLLMAILAQYIKNAFVMTFSAIWFLLSSLTTYVMAEDIFGYSVVLFFVLFAALLGWHSAVMYKKYEEKKRMIYSEDD